MSVPSRSRDYNSQRARFVRHRNSPATMRLCARYFRRLSARLKALSLSPIETLRRTPSYEAVADAAWERVGSRSSKVAQQDRAALPRTPSFPIGPVIEMPDDFFAALPTVKRPLRMQQTVHAFIRDLYLEDQSISYKALWRKLGDRLGRAGAKEIQNVCDEKSIRADRYEFKLVNRDGKTIKCIIRFSVMQRICAHPAIQTQIG